ncbi:MAG: transposase, partial [Aggregatilineales bacterium]
YDPAALLLAVEMKRKRKSKGGVQLVARSTTSDIDVGNLSTDVNIPIEVNPAPTILTDPSKAQVQPEDIEDDYEEYPVIESANPELKIPDTIPDVEADLSSEIEALSPETSYAAQMALALTQVSLESTAESTVLIKDGEIAAFAGALPLEDIESIRDAVEGDWDAAPAQGRIRFLTMPITGMEYMLYARGLEDGFTLSLIFSGTKPLHAIRRQGKRMSEALAAIPQPDTIPEISIADVPADDSEEIVPDAIEIPDVGALTPVTLVLALRDPDDTMAETLRRLLAEGIQIQLAQKGWQLHTLDVEEDLIYLFVDAPESETSYEHIQTLKATATALMQQQFPGVNEEVWADAYMVLRPGREMTSDERQDFIHFLRM